MKVVMVECENNSEFREKLEAMGYKLIGCEGANVVYSKLIKGDLEYLELFDVFESFYMKRGKTFGEIEILFVYNVK